MIYKKTVAVDLDGVLAKYTGFKGESIIEEPAPKAKKLLQKLSAKYVVILHTCRQTEDAVNWLEHHDLLEYVDAVNYCQIGQRAGKPVAVAYIDDRAVRWNGDLNQVLVEVDKLAKTETRKDTSNYENT